MTTVETDQPTRKRWVRQRKDLGEYVAGLVAGLQARFLREPPDPEAVSALARLRRGVGREPGFDYTLERYLAVPDRLIPFVPKDGPADPECAAHDAVTLYALHQQSRQRPMHLHGSGLGVAVSLLVHQSAGPDGVRRRFAALGTASTYQETIYHLRGLTTMLRQQEIPLDYGLLADDLLTLRRPGGQAHVQAAWGREFYRARPGESTATPSTTNHAPEEDAS